MTTPAESEFDVEGVRFRVQRLSPDDACRGLEVIGKVLGPAALEVFSGSAPNYGAVLAALLGNASQLAMMLGLFAPRTKFFRAVGAAWVDLKPFTDEVFGGRVDLLIAFLFHAARAEYSSFLSGSGALAGLMAELGASSSESPTAPTG